MAGCQKSFLLWSYWYTASNEIIMSRNVSKARGIIPLNSSTDAPRRMRTRAGLAERRREEGGSPRVCLYHFGCLPKRLHEGSCDFPRSQFKKKNYSIVKCAFLFILLVWAFKAVLVAVGLALHIRVTFFSFLSVLLWHLSSRWWHWCWSVRLLQPTTREKARGEPQVGSRCLKELPLLPNSTFYCCFLFCFAKQGNSALRTLLSALYQRTTVCCFYFMLIFWVRLALRTILQLLFFFFLKNHFLFF